MTVPALTFYRTSDHTCSYINAQARTVFLDPAITVTPEVYQKLSHAGFRRSGNYIYRPNCQSCQQCVSSRVLVQEFEFSRQYRRCFNANKDLNVSITSPRITAEFFSLYQRYINARHRDGDMYPANEEQYQSFFLSTWAQTQFIEFRTTDNTLVMVAVVDCLNDGWSAIYTFFEPSLASRSLGKYAILWQIMQLKQQQKKYLYLGYWVKDCPNMAYKITYQPQEHFSQDHWQLVNSGTI